MKKKNRFVKFLQKKKRSRRKKKSFQFLAWFKKTKKKKSDEKLLVGLVSAMLVLVIILFLQQAVRFSSHLIQLEAQGSRQKVQLELNNLEIYMIGLEGDFRNNLRVSKWSVMEGRNQLAKKVRHLNYLNAHLLKTIEAYNQDFSLQLYQNNLVGLKQTFQEVRNAQLISNRIANKIDTLLLFETVNKNQKELLEKDLDLFYEKMRLINLFGSGTVY